MTSQPGTQKNAMHILPKFSRSKSNQAMKLINRIEYNMRNIFLEKSCSKYGVETISRTFSKNLKLSLSLDK